MSRKVNYGLDYDNDYYDDDYDDYAYDDVDDEDYGGPDTKQETIKPGLWQCSICTYDNDENMTFCDICGVVRVPWLTLELPTVTKQLSVTIGIVLAYLLGLFVNWRILAILGISSCDAATFGLGAMQVAMAGIATSLVDRSGRRMLLILSSSIMTLSLLLVATTFYLEMILTYMKYWQCSLLWGFWLWSLDRFSLCIEPIPWIIMSEW